MHKRREVTIPSDIKKAPSEYEGTLGDLYTRWAEHVLLEPSSVEQFHKQLCVYLKSTDPLFLVRKVSKLERGETRSTTAGNQLRLTDNAPAWWIHKQIFSGNFGHNNSFEEFIEDIPCEFLDVQKRAPKNVNEAGWHVAHIFDAKDGKVGWRDWDRNELIRRFARNVHPCNYFYVPKHRWRDHGGEPTVIAFFYNKFLARYRLIWDEFLELVGGKPIPMLQNASTYWYSTVSRKNSSDTGTNSPIQKKSSFPEQHVSGSDTAPKGKSQRAVLRERREEMPVTNASGKSRFHKIDYNNLTVKQKKIYNYHKIAARLADYGFNCIKLADDLQGADFFAYHNDASQPLRVQLKTRLTIEQKNIGKALFVTFPVDEDWYFVEHDELVRLAGELTSWLKQDSWIKGKKHWHTPRPSTTMLEALIIAKL